MQVTFSEFFITESLFAMFFSLLKELAWLRGLLGSMLMFRYNVHRGLCPVLDTVSDKADVISFAGFCSKNKTKYWTN